MIPQNDFINLSSAVGLGLIGFDENDITVDYGCMCFDSFVYASRLCKKIVGIVPSSERLEALKKRLVEEDVKNYELVNANYEEQHFEEVFDCVIINCFLEQLLIEVKHNKSIYFDNKLSFKIKKDNNLEKIWIGFLQTAYKGMRPDGTLYLSYANKLRFIIFLPLCKFEIMSFFSSFSSNKALSFFSLVKTIYSYSYYLLSKKGFEILLKTNGFVDIEKYAVFPNHKYPLKIIPLSKLDECSFEPQYIYRDNPLGRISAGIKRRVEKLIFNKFKLFELSPSFIITARKTSWS